MIKYIMKIVCILLLVSSLAVLFMPSWVSDDVEVSPAEYILHPGDYKTLTREFRDITDTKKLTTRNALPIFVLMALSGACAVFSIVRIKKDLCAVLTMLIGILGVYVYSNNVLLKAGQTHMVGFVLSVVMIVTGLAILAYLRLQKAKV